MRIQYFPGKTMSLSLLLDPESLEGVIFDEKSIAQISLANGRNKRFYYTKADNSKESEPYHYRDIKEETWENIRDCARKDNHRETRKILKIIKPIIKPIENDTQFVQRVDSTQTQKEVELTPQAA